MDYKHPKLTDLRNSFFLFMVKLSDSFRHCERRDARLKRPAGQAREGRGGGESHALGRLIGRGSRSSNLTAVFLILRLFLRIYDLMGMSEDLFNVLILSTNYILLIYCSSILAL